MKNKTVLVTGDRGTIGKVLVPLLQLQGFDVVGSKRPSESTNVEYRQIELIPFAAIESPNLVAIINLSGLYSVDSDPETLDRMFESNCGLAVSIANLAKELRIPVIQAGTFFEFAPVELLPWSAYSITKLAASDILKESASRNGIGFMELVLFDNYGGNPSRKKFIDQLIELASVEKPLEATEGLQVQDLTHINDVCEAFVTALNFMIENPDFVGVRQVRSKEVLSLREIVALFNRQSPTQLKVDWGSRTYRHREVFEIWDCAPNLENWSPKRKLAEYFSELNQSNS
ncbi:WcaG Nucleoside-diphosphate-sugar epimerases [Candidatus Nanopelagicaceae bacterium]